MANITLKGNPIQTVGNLPPVGAPAPGFKLTATDLSEKTLDDYRGMRVVLNISPSVDTSVCAASVRRFNEEASGLKNTVVLYISADLPFAHARFCEAEGLERVIPLSVFRAPEFGEAYGVTITSGPMSGLLSRAVVVIDGERNIAYTEQVPEITREPDYGAVLSALASLPA